MGEVLLATAGLMLVGAVLMALFLPARATRVEPSAEVAAA
jgi:hypothetical protein